jgi:hypothetical protein
VPRSWLVFGGLFAAYLGLRLVQGVIWIIQHV